MILVEKRDGTQVPFDKQKIIDAINKAFIEVDSQLYETDTAKDIADEIYSYACDRNQNLDHRPTTLEEIFERIITVEEIQDLVEDYLMRSERRDVARAYIRYRYKKEIARNYQHDFVDAIKEKLEAKNVKNQNANVDEHSFGGRTGEASSVVTKKFALDYLVSKKARENHENNRIYIHDLDAYYVGSHNCLSIPFDDLLANGFNTRQGDIRPAGSVGTAFQLVAVIFQLQSLQQFGGVSATHLDWTMVPYVRKSFYKHFMTGMEYIQGVIVEYENGKKVYHGTIGMYDPNLYNDTLSISDKTYKYYPNAFKYAMDITEHEVYQAVEAMYHNLK